MSPLSLTGQLRIDRGMRVAIIGRLSLITVERARRTLVRMGAKPYRRFVPRTKLVVIGQGAAVLLASGEWDDLMRQVHEGQVACASELTLLRALGLAPSAPLANRSVPVPSIARPGVLDPPTLQILQLFDLMDAVDDKVDFQTAVLVREIGRLLEAGVGMPEIVMTLAPSRRRALVGLAPHPSHGGRLVADKEGGIAVRVGAWLSDLDGQLRLGIHPAANATADDWYAIAEQAEHRGDLAAAERAFRACIALDRADAVAHFNLANVLVRQGRRAEAMAHYHKAGTLDALLAEAWYNLAHCLLSTGRWREAKGPLERALAADPHYADALFNLANACMNDGEMTRAGALFTRYLVVEDQEPWGTMARNAIQECASATGGQHERGAPAPGPAAVRGPRVRDENTP